MELKIITQEELNKKLELHREWLKDNTKGERLDLSYTNLRCANLSSANLKYADLSYTNLENADLRCANLKKANLEKANLEKADLSYASLYGANLNSANLKYAELYSANLMYANLEEVRTNNHTLFYALQCPEEGSFIGFKKCVDNRIVKLLITEDSKRSSATRRQCRASKVKVLEIQNIDKTQSYNEAVSMHDENFIYKVGGNNRNKRL